MNKIKIITSVIIALSLSMVNGATVGLSKSTLERANSSANSYLNLNISSDEDVFGIQFEMTFNSNELNLVDVRSLMEEYTFEYRVKEDSVIRGLMFSLQGAELLSASEIANILEFEFEAGERFTGSSIIDFNDVILAGQHGQELEVSVSSQEVTFNTAFIPTETSLSNNYPNPFNPSTTVEYALSMPGVVSLVIYDLNGAEVRTLKAGFADAGKYEAIWNGLNNQGYPVASGRYILKMTASNFTDSITLTLLK